MSSNQEWWRDAIVYQVYLRSFADANGDGVGDIAGLRSRLDYISSLGVDGIWVNPWYESPLNDGGYDVSDYRSIHPQFGTLEEARLLIEEADDLGLKFLVDLVPNHTSSEHPWFKAALKSEPGSKERSRYHFVDGLGPEKELPPNNWRSVFGGPAWTRVPDGQWYLHLFDVTQPDLNWENPEVRAEFRNIIRFWLDLGANGFRVDVAHAKVKAPGYPDLVDGQGLDLFESSENSNHPIWDRPGVQDIVKEWRSILDEYPDTVMVAEAWLPGWNRLAEYLRPGKYHQAFEFLFLRSPWDATEMRSRVDVAIRSSAEVGSVPTWALSNHDVVRHPTRYGLPADVDARRWLLDGDRNLLDHERGRRRARAATLFVLALPGSVYLYQGEELGLHEVYQLPLDVLEDPVWRRSGNTEKGRDGCRVPIPWAVGGPSFGFGENEPWLPQPDHWGSLSVEAQEADPDSTLSLYRTAISLRARWLQGDESFQWLDYHPLVVAFRRGALSCFINFSEESFEIPDGRLIVSSIPLQGRELPRDVAAWVLTDE